MTGLTWRYHTLIQALLSRGPLKEEEFHEIFIGISGKNPGLDFSNLAFISFFY
jgi:non-structural maintenance of chromosomes element 1